MFNVQDSSMDDFLQSEYLPTLVTNMNEIIENYFPGTANKINLRIAEYIIDHRRKISNEVPSLSKRSYAAPRTYWKESIKSINW